MSEQTDADVPLLEVEHVTQHFPVKSGVHRRPDRRCACTRSTT